MSVVFHASSCGDLVYICVPVIRTYMNFLHSSTIQNRGLSNSYNAMPAVRGRSGNNILDAALCLMQLCMIARMKILRFYPRHLMLAIANVVDISIKQLTL
jgi:hypothetical protein